MSSCLDLSGFFEKEVKLNVCLNLFFLAYFSFLTTTADFKFELSPIPDSHMKQVLSWNWKGSMRW